MTSPARPGSLPARSSFTGPGPLPARSSLTRPEPLLAAIVLAALLLGCGPLGPIPGGRLRGTVVEPPPVEWSGVEAVRTAQLETRPDDPHSINIWTGVVEGRLYVTSSLIRGPDDPNERDWVRHVLEDPRVRLRIDGRIYELTAVRVEDPARVEAVRSAMIAKYDVEPDAHSDAAWVFRLEPRDG